MCEFNSPALRISNIVKGRERRPDGRVVYYLDPLGENGDPANKKLIPEKIVLQRWKLRSNESESMDFSGMRLSPNIWRSLHVALGSDYRQIIEMTEEEIDANFDKAGPDLTKSNFKKMAGSKVKKITDGLGLNDFIKLMVRHNSPEHAGIFGTPDLFLYAQNRLTKEIEYIRFVEVKKPDEPLRQDQVTELKFLNEIKIKARVLRLIERD